MGRSIAPSAVHDAAPLRLAVFASSPDELLTLKAQFEARGAAVTAVLVPSELVPVADIDLSGKHYRVICSQVDLAGFFNANKGSLDAVFAPVGLTPFSGHTIAREAKLRQIPVVLQAQPAAPVAAVPGLTSQAPGTLSKSELEAARQGGYALVAYDAPDIIGAVMAAIPQRTR